MSRKNKKTKLIKTPLVHPDHQMLEDKIYNTLKNRKYVTFLQQNYEYPNGQLDVYECVGGRHIYYEVKRTYTQNTRKKAVTQGNRWLEYQKQNYPHDNSYVVMVTRTKMKIIGRYAPWQLN